MELTDCGDVHKNPGPGPPRSRVPHTLNAVSWNCRAVGKRIDVLALNAKLRALDVIALQETNLRPGEPTPALLGYRAFRRDRTMHKNPGPPPLNDTRLVTTSLLLWEGKMDVNRCGDVHRHPGPDVLRAVSWNCRTVNGKITALAYQASQRGLDVIALQETNLGSDDPTPTLRGYRAYRKDRTTPRVAGAAVDGGGLLTYVRETLRSAVVQYTMPAADTVTERLDVRVWTAANPIVVSNIYLPPVPSGSGDTRPRNYLMQESLPAGNHVFVCGDFNAHHPLWGGLGTQTDQRGRVVAAWLDSADYRVWNEVGVRTWMRGGSTSTIDLVVSSSDADPSSWCALDSWGSDHSPLMFEMECDGPVHATRTRPTWNFHKTDWKEYVRDVERRLKALAGTKDVDKFAKGVADAFTEVAEERIPRCGGFVSNQPWWNDDVARAYEERDALRRAVLAGRSNDVDGLATLDRAAQVAIDTAKQERWAQLCDGFCRSKDLGAAFRAVKHLDGRGHREVLPMMEDGGTPLVSDRCKADRLGLFYARQGSKVAAPGATQIDPNPEPTTDGCEPFSMDEMEGQLDGLKERSAAGDDGVFNTMMMHLSREGREVLLQLFNRSWSTGRVPNTWRTALVIPVLKPGKDPMLLSSYRPISLTSCVCKLMERMVNARMTHLLDDEGTGVEGLHASQAGFRTGRSTEEHVAAVTQKVADLREEKRKCMVLLFDLSRAFDLVCHKSLIAKMRAKGFPPMYVQWVQSFLKGRTARVRVGSVLGTRYKVRSGVPQGSVLGPTLFTIFLDDLARLLDELADLGVVYADDVAAVVSGADTVELAERAQKVIDAIEDWCARWGMSLSTDKTCALLSPPVDGYEPGLHFRSTRTDVQPDDLRGVEYEKTTPVIKKADESGVVGKRVVALDGLDVHHKSTVESALGNGSAERVTLATPLRLVKTAKYLGVTLDSEFTFVPHATDVVARMEKRMRVLRLLAGTNWGCRWASLRALYVTYVMPVMMYCFGVWFQSMPNDNEGKRVRKELEDLHWSAALLISGCVEKSGKFPVLAEAGLTSLGYRATAAAGILLQRCLRWPNTPAGRVVAESSGVYGWLRIARAVCSQVGLYDLTHERLDGTACPPWGPPPPTIYTMTPMPTKRTDSDKERLRAGLAAVARCPQGAVAAYTDGSVIGGHGGAGAVVFPCAGEEEPKVLMTRSAGPFCSSYRAEMSAVHAACEWYETVLADGEMDTPRSLNIFTDSQSLLVKLAGGPGGSREELEKKLWRTLWTLARRHGAKVTMQFVPSHCGVPGNEEADGAARQGALLRSATVDYGSAKTCLKGWAREAWQREYNLQDAKRHREATGGAPPVFPSNFKRSDEVVISRLRTAQTALLRGYLQPTGPNRRAYMHNIKCPACEAPKLCRDHLLRECPKLSTLARRHYDTKETLAHLLTKCAAPVLAFLKGSGLLRWSKTGQYDSTALHHDSPPRQVTVPNVQLDLFA
eukprot:TRINITY_DN373_c0_g2_i4.p1 TRINITY_DN373_c0_g2~~TRINITY_DN373_c0_g2_i4.p1  ORF type:complete len:1476 (+),score=293.52 TRINITY_DN373_c0_g2_i4:2254-6681(+)